MSVQPAEHIIEALTYLQKFSGECVLIKLGGSILNNKELVKSLCADLKLLKSAHMTFVLVHGGGQAINQVLNQYQLSSTFQDGLRITTDAMMDLIEMALCGQVNQHLVRTLNSVGVCAVGLSGADNHLFQCEPYSQTHHRVGKITHLNTQLIEYFIAQQYDTAKGIIPVVAPVGMDIQGQALNINADNAASELAIALKIKKIIYLTDQDGIFDQKKQIISRLNVQQLEELIQTKVVLGGMLAKVNAIMNALQRGHAQIHIINGKRPHSLLHELLTDAGVGTLCVRE